MRVCLSFTSVKDEASFVISMVEILHAHGKRSRLQLKEKPDHVFLGEEMFHISHFHMSLLDSKAKT
jgi:hypothetical protein